MDHVSVGDINGAASERRAASWRAAIHVARRRRSSRRSTYTSLIGVEGPTVVDPHRVVLDVGRPAHVVGDPLAAEAAGLAPPAGRELLGRQRRVPPPERHHLEAHASCRPPGVEVVLPAAHHLVRDDPARVGPEQRRAEGQVGVCRAEPGLVGQALPHVREPLEVDRRIARRRQLGQRERHGQSHPHGPPGRGRRAPSRPAPQASGVAGRRPATRSPARNRTTLAVGLTRPRPWRAGRRCRPATARSTRS